MNKLDCLSDDNLVSGHFLYSHIPYQIIRSLEINDCSIQNLNAGNNNYDSFSIYIEEIHGSNSALRTC